LSARTRIIWALAFAGVIATMRWLVLQDAASWSSGYLRHVLAAAPSFVMGYLLSFPAGLLGWPMRLLGYGIAALVVMTSTMAFHYHAYFGRYPGGGITFYLGELGTLAPSITANVPLYEVGLGGLLAVALLAGIQRVSKPGKKRDRAAHGTGAMALVPLALAIGLGTLPWVSERWRVSTTEAVQDPLLHLLGSWLGGLFQARMDAMPEGPLFLDYQAQLGHRMPFARLVPDAPLCGPRASPHSANGRSVIVLVLESVSGLHVDISEGAEPLMPNLREVTRASSTRYFANHYAVGTKSSQASTAIFSGVPAQVDTHLLWQRPLPVTQSLVRALRRDGYRTAYLHGGDLSFEQQRVYLRQSGFEEIYEPGPDKAHQAIGWGYDDEAMFAELRAWIETHRAKDEGRPYLVGLATLTSHDPFFVPARWRGERARESQATAFQADWWSGLSETDLAAREVEAFRFLDHHFGRFYRWYERFEKPRGTVLVVVGDHTATSIHGNRERGPVERYRVPLLFAGDGLPDLDGRHLARTASQVDIQRTLSGLLAKAPPECDQGIDLLVVSGRWPDDRLVYAVEGDFNEMVVFADSWSATFSRGANELDIALRSTDSEARSSSLAVEAVRRRATEFVNATFKVSRYLTDNQAFAPPGSAAQVARPPHTRGTEPPIVIAHRGNSRGLIPGRAPENSREAIRQAARDGFSWVEIDLQVTRDGVPVVHHDPTVEVEGRAVPIAALTRNELVELPCCVELMTLRDALAEAAPGLGLLVEAKPQAHVMRSTAMERAVGELLYQLRGETRIIVDSFSPKTAAAIRRTCHCESGLDLPQDAVVDEAWLQHVVNLDLDWIYLEKSMVDADAVRMAHEHGVKVMVYTVNEVADLARWEDAWPDGIITDDRRVLVAVEEHFKSLGTQAFRVR
jgi:glycerophosphoryl diester phosphodiesterase